MLNTRILANANSFKYLEITLQSRGIYFSQHISGRTTLSVKAMHNMKDVTKVSMEAATKLFHIKILPIATFSMGYMGSPRLQRPQNARENEINILHLKKAAGLLKFDPSRTVYEKNHFS